MRRSALCSSRRRRRRAIRSRKRRECRELSTKPRQLGGRAIFEEHQGRQAPASVRRARRGPGSRADPVRIGVVTRARAWHAPCFGGRRERAAGLAPERHMGTRTRRATVRLEMPSRLERCWTGRRSWWDSSRRPPASRRTPGWTSRPPFTSRWSTRSCTATASTRPGR